MIHVNIEDLKTGMILAQPVKNNQGVLLLDADAKITPKNIRIFKSWGVNKIYVKGNLTASKGSEGEPENQIKVTVEMELKEKFCDVLDDPVMVEIYKAASNQLSNS